MKRTTLCLMTSLLAGGSANAFAQDRPAATETPLKLQVVMTRYDGEKKVSSLPYTVLVNATDPENVTKRPPKQMMMGVQVPLQVTIREAPSVVFKDVGSRISCLASTAGGGRYSR